MAVRIVGVWIGTPGMTVPIWFEIGFARMGDTLPSMINAIDLPPKNRMRVATMGWTLKNETRVPLKAPITSPATQLMRKPARMVQMVTPSAFKTYWTKMAELIAPISPMLIS